MSTIFSRRLFFPRKFWIFRPLEQPSSSPKNSVLSDKTKRFSNWRLNSCSGKFIFGFFGLNSNLILIRWCKRKIIEKKFKVLRPGVNSMKYELLGLGGAMNPSTLAPTINTNLSWNKKSPGHLSNVNIVFCENETQFEFFSVKIYKIRGLDFAFSVKMATVWAVTTKIYTKNNTPNYLSKIQIQFTFYIAFRKKTR